jgi:biotin synthase
MVRLSAGRLYLSESEQALCFLAGANSIFAGDKLLTTANNGASDKVLFQKLGLVPRPPHKDGQASACAQHTQTLVAAL